MFELFRYDFMVRAFTAGCVIGIIAPLIGTFLVLRRYSLLADTLSHVSLLGVAVASFAHLPPMIGALSSSAIAAIGIERLREKRDMFGESVLALFLSGSLASAVILLSLARGSRVNFISYLFGSITTVTVDDLRIVSILGFVVLLMTLLLFKRFFLVSYDEELAKANGLPVGMLNGVLMMLAAMTVSLSLRIVGALLVGALMVIPVLTAAHWTKRFATTCFFAIILSILCVLVGLYGSFYLNIPSGATIVLTTLLLFIMSLGVTRVLSHRRQVVSAKSHV